MDGGMMNPRLAALRLMLQRQRAMGAPMGVPGGVPGMGGVVTAGEPLPVPMPATAPPAPPGPQGPTGGPILFPRRPGKPGAGQRDR